MTVSSLSKGSILTPNHYNGRAYPITKVTIHEMAAVWTAQRCGEWFRDGTRNASSNYGIGNDGTIMCYVEEQNAAWTSANWDNDNRAITIEVSNSVMGGDWPISRAAYDSLVALCADICNRYGIVPNYNGTPNASFTEHKMFVATACPGPYIHSLLTSGKIISDIRDAMEGRKPSPSRRVQLFPINGTDAQRWIPEWQKDGTVVLVSKSCGLALDVEGGDGRSTVTVQCYPKNGSNAQKWKVEQISPGYKPKAATPFELIPVVNTKLRLDVAGGSKDEGARIQIYDANGTSAQKWVIVDDGSGAWTLLNVGSLKALDVVNGGK